MDIKTYFQDQILDDVMNRVVFSLMEYAVSTIFMVEDNVRTFDITHSQEFYGTISIKKPGENMMSYKTRLLERRNLIPWFYKATSKLDQDRYYGVSDSILLAQGVSASIELDIQFTIEEVIVKYALTDINLITGDEIYRFPTSDDLVRFLNA